MASDPVPTHVREYRQFLEGIRVANRLSLPAYANSDLPTAPYAQSFFHDTNRGTIAWWDADHYEFPTFVDDVLTTEQTVSNTTTRTEVFNPDINADSLLEGRVYEIDLSGKFSTANTSDTFTVDVNLAGATDVAGISNAPANATDAPWSMEMKFTVREDGENGVIQPHTRGLFDSQPADSHHSPVSVDTTTTTELSVDIQWDAADPDNTVTLGQAHLKQMG